MTGGALNARMELHYNEDVNTGKLLLPLRRGKLIFPLTKHNTSCQAFRQFQVRLSDSETKLIVITKALY